MNENEQAYYPSFLLVFAMLVLLGSGCAAVVWIVLERLEYASVGLVSYTFLRILCIVYIWALACAVAIRQGMSIRIGARGIRGRTFWGRHRFLVWEDMNRSRRLGIAPLRFLRVTTNAAGPPMWVPLFLGQRKRFRSQVVEYAGEGHPVTEMVR